MFLNALSLIINTLIVVNFVGSLQIITQLFFGVGIADLKYWHYVKQAAVMLELEIKKEYEKS